jgi:hypothetical protein
MSVSFVFDGPKRMPRRVPPPTLRPLSAWWSWLFDDSRRKLWIRPG